MSTDEKIAGLRAEFLEISADQFRSAMEWCESPIEQLLMAKLLCEGWSYPDIDRGTFIRKMAKAAGIPKRHPTLCSGDFEGVGLMVQPELTVEGSNYRLDIAIFAAGEKVVVELDGHDFHERTKAQAQRDKSRDRKLTRAGWRILRFTGSEVYRDVGAVYEEIARTIEEAEERDAKELADDRAKDSR